MRMNSDASIKLGREVFREYGSWEAIRKAGRRRKDGTLEVPKRNSARSPKKTDSREGAVSDALPGK